MKIVDYLFFRIYRLFFKTNYYRDIAPQTTAIAISVMFYFIFLSVIRAFGKTTFQDFFINKILLIFFALLFSSISYLYFYKSKRYERIIQKYENESKRQRRLGCLFIFIIFLIIILAFLIVPNLPY